MQKFKINRDVTQNECSWLEKDFKKGTIVYEYCGATYGCVGAGGIPVTFAPGQTPFSEIPASALSEI